MASSIPALAELYLRFKLDKEAVAVAEEGSRIVQPDEKNIKASTTCKFSSANAAQMRGDKAGQLAAVEKAEKFAGDKHPEFAFNLGSTYATMDPPQKEKAVRLLNQFTKRVCRGAKAQAVPGAVRDQPRRCSRSSGRDFESALVG